jgi:hypothetical protein
MRGHSVRGVKTRWTAWLCSLAVLCGCGAMPLPAPPLKTAIIDGAELHYTDEGVGETVLLLHGAGSDLRIWDEIRPFSRRAIASSPTAGAITIRRLGPTTAGRSLRPPCR